MDIAMDMIHNITIEAMAVLIDFFLVVQWLSFAIRQVDR